MCTRLDAYRKAVERRARKFPGVDIDAAHRTAERAKSRKLAYGLLGEKGFTETLSTREMLALKSRFWE
jgi:hypothetical protein